MGQNLNHGVYLPAEGERNCYSGLASNWNLLDTAIGDIAGKASATHTHGNITNDGKVGTTANLPLITGTGGAITAGAFGNQANTFCEGNDSRLSDARTPVAHTHVTSEVLKTGSAFTGGTVTNPYFKIASWEIGANQYFGAMLLVQNSNYPHNQAFVSIEIRTYSNYNFQTGCLYLSNDCGISKESLCICYKQESNKVLCELYYYDTTTWNGIFFSVLNESLRYGGGTLSLFQTMTVYNQQQSDAVANLPAGYTVIQANYMPLFQNVIPGANNTYDLGSSSYQWNNLYAQSYYYNGVAWGLDKANVWTGNNTFSDATNCVLSLKFGTSDSYSDIRYYDSNNANYACLRSRVLDLTLGVKYSSKSAWYDGASVVIRNDGNVQIKSYDGTENWTINFTPVGVYPTSDKALELGTSTHKWKSLNGVNPGALSLPDMDSTVSKTTELAAAIDKTQAANSWTADFTGILSITWYVKGLTGPFRCAVFNNADIRYATWGQTFSANDMWYFIISFPVQNGKTYYFDNSFTRTSVDTAPILYGASAVYCLGNV